MIDEMKNALLLACYYNSTTVPLPINQSLTHITIMIEYSLVGPPCRRRACARLPFRMLILTSLIVMVGWDHPRFFNLGCEHTRTQHTLVILNLINVSLLLLLQHCEVCLPASDRSAEQQHTRSRWCVACHTSRPTFCFFSTPDAI